MTAHSESPYKQQSSKPLPEKEVQKSNYLKIPCSYTYNSPKKSNKFSNNLIISAFFDCFFSKFKRIHLIVFLYKKYIPKNKCNTVLLVC